MLYNHCMLRKLFLTMALLLLPVAGLACDRVVEKPRPAAQAEKTALSETTVPTQWAPKHDTEGQLRIRLDPADAKVDVVSLGENDGLLPVKLEVLDYGHNNGNPNNSKSLQVGVRLTRSRFISQVYQIYEPAREVTPVLVRVRFEPDRIEKSFKRAAKAYRMPLAYPTYIPFGYNMKTPEFQGIIQDIGSIQGPADFLYLQWSKGVSPVAWSEGSSSIAMQFYPPHVKRFIGGKGFGKPEKIREIKHSDGVIVKLSKSKAHFVIDGKETSWQILFSDVPPAEAEKVVRGMRLVDFEPDQ